MGRSRLAAAALVLLGPAVGARADEADVVGAGARCDAAGLCEFAVTVKHADTGWDHYADRFEVLGPDGTILATRVLRHPHVDEQPFTRGMRGVAIPLELGQVGIRAHDSQHGYGGRMLEVALERPDPRAPAPPGP